MLKDLVSFIKSQPQAPQVDLQLKMENMQLKMESKINDFQSKMESKMNDMHSEMEKMASMLRQMFDLLKNPSQ